jgi:hypothetical protein
MLVIVSYQRDPGWRRCSSVCIELSQWGELVSELSEDCRDDIDESLCWYSGTITANNVHAVSEPGGIIGTNHCARPPRLMIRIKIVLSCRF